MIFEDIKIPERSSFLVTGGAGFIGSNIAEALSSLGFKVKVLDSLETGRIENISNLKNNPDFEFIKGDICNEEVCRFACRGADYVIHQAALGSVPRSIEEPAMVNAVNISGTLNMLIAARDCGVKRFVFASSSSVYGDDENLPKVEKRIGMPLSPYALTKLSNELYAGLFFKLFGLKTIGLRYFNVFGKRQDPRSKYSAVIPIFISKLLHDEAPTIYGDGQQSRDFTYIENVIRANLLACIADERAFGDVFNIANGGRISLNELYETICVLVGKNIPPVYTNERVGDIKHSNADISKARSILGYYPVKEVAEGLAESLEWYKNQTWLL